MRLTNISQMRLPVGTVASYGSPLRARLDRPLPVSFDQGRHVGAGDRPGSWMAISFRLPHGTGEAAVAAAWEAVIARHGTLRTVFVPAPDGGVLLYDGEVASPGTWMPHPAAPGQSTAAVVREVFDALCRPFAEPSHRIALVVPAADETASDTRPVLIVGSDHAHVDMWSLLVVARDLSEALGGDSPRTAVAPFAAHTEALERMPAAPAEVTDAWNRVLRSGRGLMPVFPLPLGDVSAPRAEVVEVRDVLDAEGERQLSQRAEALGVRPTAVALSVLAELSLRDAGVPLRAVFPVHSRTDTRWHESVGWFITNAVIDVDEPTPAGCAAAVRQALKLGSFPLAPVFAPYGGMPDTPGMFAISWLDLRRLPVSPPEGSDPHWISAVIRTDGVMIWFVVGDGGMHVRCRYPDTPEARVSVGGWLDRVVDGIRAVARPAAVPAP